MAVKKTELYSILWEACNKLRGGVEPARYKDYVLILLFFKYVSDKCKGKGVRAEFKISDGASFDDLIAAKNKSNVGEQTDKIIQKFLDDNELRGSLPDVSFNNTEELGTGKELVDKVSGLISVFQNPAIDFKNNHASGDDIIGDAYEYFMMKFAQESGKSKGQFYTPSEVSRTIARLIEISKIKITSTKRIFTLYDPACGSSSLLIRAADEAPLNTQGNTTISIYGQEKDTATAGLATMNLILHGWNTAEIKKGNSLVNPAFLNDYGKLQTFDFVVMNPPFSDKSWSDGIKIDEDKFNRFDDYGNPPEKNGDYAWFLHVLKSLNNTGKAGIIMPHGVLFRGNSEELIRKNILVKKYIKGIISLPANLFYGTGIPACIVIIDKENAETRNGVFLIDASHGFKKDGNKNRLREQDIEKIVQTFNKQEEIFGYSRFVTYEEILKNNGGNLNVPRYIQRINDTIPQNIAAHLQGGIPIDDIDSLAKLWRISPELKHKIFICTDEQHKIYKLKISSENLSEVIKNDKQIQEKKFEEVEKFFNDWCKIVKNDLINIQSDINPQKLIRKISEQLLEIYQSSHLLDNYSVYDCLLNYWIYKMQDDIYAIKIDGYEAGREIDFEYVKKKTKNGLIDDTTKFKSFDGLLIPKKIIESEYFAEDLKVLNQLADKSMEIDSDLFEMREENSGEDGLFYEVLNDKGEIIKGVLKDRLKRLERNKIFDDEYYALKIYQEKLEKKDAIDKKIKVIRAILDKKVIDKYTLLTIEEIKYLLFDLTWTAKIKSDILDEFEQVLNILLSRVIRLSRRYEFTLDELEERAAKSKAQVMSALERMGFKW